MHIGPLGLPEIIIILLVVLIIFGPKNLPKLGKAVGRTVANLRDGLNSGKKDDEESEDSEGEAKAEQAEAAVVVEDDDEKKAE